MLLSLALVLSSVFYAVALGLSLWGFVKFILWVIFIDCIGAGVIIASALWLVSLLFNYAHFFLNFRAFSNKFLRKVKDQDVEWGYCFDVHLNAFFPMLILLHVLLPIAYPRKFINITLLFIFFRFGRFARIFRRFARKYYLVYCSCLLCLYYFSWIHRCLLIFILIISF